MKVAYLSMAAGAVFVVYFIGISLAGHGTNFFFIWLAAGLLLLGAGLLLRFGVLSGKLPGWCAWTIRIGVILGLTVFFVVEGCILSGFKAKAPDGLDTIIVLGAQMKENGPSRVLRMRLDKAYDYLVNNPETEVVVSGGKGVNEPVSEAQGMADYLIGLGIDEGRIKVEDRSVNTATNLLYSAELVNPESDKIGIVTNNFHIFRAVHIARKAGYREVYGIPAPSETGFLPNNMLREFFGVCKDFLTGNM